MPPTVPTLRFYSVLCIPCVLYSWTLYSWTCSVLAVLGLAVLGLCSCILALLFLSWLGMDVTRGNGVRCDGRASRRGAVVILRNIYVKTGGRLTLILPALTVSCRRLPLLSYDLHHH